uniref:Uncharacterized protein n=1 Tax=Arundo donax TaxID=35708 RepID=A0A0A9BK62_ARUDO
MLAHNKIVWNFVFKNKTCSNFVFKNKTCSGSTQFHCNLVKTT